MAESEPRPEWADSCCSVCPAQSLAPGMFDVVGGPGRQFLYVPELDYRIDITTNVPTCVHPFRVGLPPAPYASKGAPLPGPDAEPPARPVRSARPGVRRALPVFTPTPEQLVLPGHVDDLEAWMIAMLRTAAHSEMDSALAQAESIASSRFSSGEIVTALRRVLTSELAG